VQLQPPANVQWAENSTSILGPEPIAIEASQDALTLDGIRVWFVNLLFSSKGHALRISNRSHRKRTSRVVTTRKTSAASMRITATRLPRTVLSAHACVQNRMSRANCRQHPYMYTHVMQVEKAMSLEANPGLGCGCGLRQVAAPGSRGNIPF
jgi:hypothetical protein